MVVDAFTISSNNYLGMARVFAESYLEHHPESSVYVCLVDQPDERVAYADFPFQIIAADELGIPEFKNIAFRYNVLELNTAVKPFVFKYLREKEALDRGFYFDPDILVCDRLSELEDLLEDHLAVLTPHLTQPIDNRYRPPERVIGTGGVYNLGFIGLRLDDRTDAFLDWWCDRLLRFCVIDLQNGIFVDQSWMNFAPAYLESVAIVRESIYNIAYWNLPHRRPELEGAHWKIDGRRVGFFHFSGVDFNNLDIISRHQNRLDLWARPELRPLFEDYRDRVARSGQTGFRRIPYSYGFFAGTEIKIPWIARIAYQVTDPRGLRWPDPFLVGVEDSFLGWLTEPLMLDDQIVNRTVLYLWQERPDIRDQFPDLRRGDLSRYLEWFFDFGATDEGFHDVFVDPIRPVSAPVETSPCDTEFEEVAQIDLSNPGDRTTWLNNPVDSVHDPVLTRLCMVIHRACGEVAERFPEPLQRQRLAFALWFIEEGAVSYGLHDDLVDPVRRTLPTMRRIFFHLRNVISRMTQRRQVVPGARISPDQRVQSEPDESSNSEGPLEPESYFPLEIQGLASCRPETGVNLVGFFEGERGVLSFAPDVLDTLRATGLPLAVVPLDRVLPEQANSYRYRYDEGLPFPVTILVAPSDSWVPLLWRLPLGNWLGTKVIGYCTEIRDTLAAEDAKWVDEVWTPSDDLAVKMAGLLPVPTRVVPPVLLLPRGTDEQPSILDQERFWFLTIDGGPGEENQRAASEAIECIRRLDRAGNSRIGLCLAVGRHRSSLKRQLEHLPIRVVAEPLNNELIERLLSACDGVLDMRAGIRIDPVLARAARRGKPIVAVRRERDRIDRASFVGEEEPLGRDGRDGAIGLAIAAMCDVAGGRDLGLERTEEPGDGQVEFRAEDPSSPLWATEVRRLLNDARTEGMIPRRAEQSVHNGGADVSGTADDPPEGGR